jgi:DNA helicase-2/ATP-dependent DNA helicase PcrA
MNELKKFLNEEQFKAVTHGEGPALVLAGAGTGKTRVLTFRIYYLVKYKNINPENIFATTFTNKAADEMRERISSLLGKEIKGIWLGTFHSLILRILRKYADRVGYLPYFSVYDREDQKNLLREIMKKEGESINFMLHRISRIKIGVEEVENEKEGEIIIEYNRRLKEANAMDFDDILLYGVYLFENYEDVREIYSSKFKHVLVDEFQDTNYVQYKFLKLISSKYRNLFVVGDEDQAIYKFRGANPENIMELRNDFKDLKIYKLEENYRSTKNILKAAKEIVEKNKIRIGKNLYTRNGEGEKIEIIETDDEREEAEKVYEIIMKEKRKLNDFLILYRTNAQSRPFEEVFLSKNLPYRVIGGIHFFDRKEIKDLLCYLYVITNPKDDISFKRIINVPPRGFGEKRLSFLEKIAKRKNLSLFETFLSLNQNEIPLNYRKEFLKARELFEYLIEIVKNKNTYDILRELVEKIDYFDYLKTLCKDEKEYEEKYSHVMELFASAKEFCERSEDKSIISYLSQISVKTDADEYDEKRGVISLLTVHNAKGLEAPCVIITGCEDGIFPHKAAFDSDDELEEERRLFHVAMTRAKEKLYILYARSRFGRGKGFLEPSRFLFDIPEDTYIWKNKPEITRKTEFEKGEKVFHPVFGIGEIIDIYDGKAEILFYKAGVKKIVLEYAKDMKKI